MGMNKRAKVLFLLFFLGFCFIMIAYVFLIWHPALPFDSKSKREVTELLGENTGTIIKLTTEENVDWYGDGPQANQATAAEAMKRAVTEKGWTFIQQDGAVYFTWSVAPQCTRSITLIKGTTSSEQGVCFGRVSILRCWLFRCRHMAPPLLVMCRFHSKRRKPRSAYMKCSYLTSISESRSRQSSGG